MHTVRLGRLWQGLVGKVVRLGVGVTRLLPTGLWLRIREEAALVRRMDYGRSPIYMCVDSWIENDVRLHSAGKEPGTVEWIESWFEPGDVFYDIGANVGVYSLIAFHFLGAKTKIYAFEPGFVTFPQLCKNVCLNGASEAIVPLQVALSDQTSVTAFNYQNLSPGGALHALGVPVDHRGREFQPVAMLPTLSYRLDEFVRQFSLPRPNHMKVDVDGIEYQVLRGSQELLGSRELRSILVEMNEQREDAKEIGKLLEINGLVLHSRRNEQNLYTKVKYPLGLGVS